MIQPHPDAPEGKVETLKSYEPSTFPATAAILCRNTSPLIAFAFGLIRRSVPCRVLGREIGQGLITLIDKLAPTDIENLEDKLVSWECRETSRLLAKGDEAGADNVRDKVACIQIFCVNNKTLSELKRKIEALFNDNPSSILTLSTIHKSKGLEWPEVFILDFDLIPSRYARTKEDLQQENNLAYVAITRAKLNLFFITSDAWKKQEKKSLDLDPD